MRLRDQRKNASEFARKVEADFGEVSLGHLEDVVGVGEEDVAALFVYGHELMLALLEGGERFGVVAFDPAGFVEADRLPATLRAIFVEEAILDDFELELTDGADDLATVELVGKQLCNAFVHQLAHTLVELLLFHRVGVLDIFEHLGRERRKPLEVEQFATGQCVADLEVARVGDADDIAGIGDVDDVLLLGHEGRRGGEAHHLVVAHVAIVDVAFELAGADLNEGDTGAMVGVHVRVDLEHKAREFLLLGTHFALFGEDGARSRSDLDEAVEKLLDTEGVESRTEEDRGNLTGKIFLFVKFGIDTLDQFYVFTELVGVSLPDSLINQRRGDIVDLDALADGLFRGGEEVESLFVDIVDTFELGAHVDRPRKGADTYMEFGFEFVKDIKGVAALAVHLVDEDDHRSFAHSADLHELACLGLDALGGVDDDDNRVDGGQSAERILGEVLVARGVEDVDLVAVIFEAHDRGCDGDSALFLDLHPVGGGSFLDLVALHRTGDMDRSPEKQQFLGEGGLTCVRVGDDGECASARNFFVQFFRHVFIFRLAVFIFRLVWGEGVSPDTVSGIQHSPIRWRHFLSESSQ